MLTIGSMLSALTMAAALAVVLAFGVVILPAVWSRRPSRREAAAKVLAQILDAVRRQSKL